MTPSLLYSTLFLYLKLLRTPLYDGLKLLQFTLTDRVRVLNRRILATLHLIYTTQSAPLCYEPPEKRKKNYLDTSQSPSYSPQTHSHTSSRTWA